MSLLGQASRDSAWRQLRPGLQAHCAVLWPPRLALGAGSPETAKWPANAVGAFGGSCKRHTPGQLEAVVLHLRLVLQTCADKRELPVMPSIGSQQPDSSTFRPCRGTAALDVKERLQGVCKSCVTGGRALCDVLQAALNLLGGAPRSATRLCQPCTSTEFQRSHGSLGDWLIRSPGCAHIRDCRLPGTASQ